MSKWMICLWIFFIIPMWGLILVVKLTDLTPDAAGNIHHPFYGTYPAGVVFQKGMTLYPGQHTYPGFNFQELTLEEWEAKYGPMNPGEATSPNPPARGREDGR